MTATATPTLADFLLARIADDETMARWAAVDGERWTSTGGTFAVEGTGGGVVYNEGRPSDEQADHIARHDPARVLAECAAKRAILERCRGLMLDEGDPAPSVYDVEAHLDGLAYDVLTALAQSYASHPDFRAEWSA